MSAVKSKVGPYEFEWLSVPRGHKGSARVRVFRAGHAPEELDISWREDADGLWLEMPGGLHGFDLQSEKDDEGRPVFLISTRGSSEAFEGVRVQRPGDEKLAGAEGGKRKGMKVKAQMPGKIVRVLVQEGASVAKDQPLLVMEAMKMENEIRAQSAGVVKQLHVQPGQTVETGAPLLVLE
jgi:biotin carboxyl carrier protein